MIDRFITRTGPITVRDGLAWAMQLIEGGEPGEAHLVLFTLHAMLDVAELDAALGRMEKAPDHSGAV